MDPHAISVAIAVLAAVLTAAIAWPRRARR
jgi:hypothetical protein